MGGYHCQCCRARTEISVKQTEKKPYSKKKCKTYYNNYKPVAGDYLISYMRETAALAVEAVLEEEANHWSELETVRGFRCNIDVIYDFKSEL